MRRRIVGEQKALVPVVGQGTWRLETARRRQAIATLRYGIELGMRHLDTAELYGRGRVERLVAEAIRGVRDEVFLTSKVRPPHTSYRAVMRACERSLRRLRTDRLDLFLLHWLGDDPMEETFAAFECLKQQGKIREYGVSNFTLPQLRQAARLVGAKSIACNQVAYSLAHRQPERDMLPYCQKSGIALVAYSPLGSGSFPPGSLRARRVLEEIAEANGATTRQVALAFLLSRSRVLVIPKHSQARHAEDNAAAAMLELTTEEIHRIEDAFPLRAVETKRPSPRKNWKGRLVEAAQNAWKRFYGPRVRPVLVPLPVR